MKFKIRCFLIVVVVFIVECNSSDNQINLFFNPSLTFDLNKISVRVKIGEAIILDTLIENKHIDESLFIKKISYSKSAKNTSLHVEINGKNKDIRQTNELSKYTDLFLRYDDHSLIFKEARKIEIEKEDNIFLQTLNNCLIV